MRMKFIGAMALALLLSAPFAGRADVSFAYQGLLLNEKGQVLSERNHTIVFRLYDQVSEGSNLWNCTRKVYLSDKGGVLGRTFRELAVWRKPGRRPGRAHFEIPLLGSDRR